MSGRSSDLHLVAFVTVTFNPDVDQLARQWSALAPGSLKVIVDNASDACIASKLRALADATDGVILCVNETNEGLAAGVNRGVREVARLSEAVRWVVLLDQDSEPDPGSIHTLLEGYLRLEAGGARVGCVGPVLVDSVTGLEHGFHQQNGWRWRRAYVGKGNGSPIPCTTLNGSGTFVSVALFESLGGLDDRLFIDHVDTEWSFRVKAAGYGLWGIPGAVFKHSMGTGSTRFWWFGWRVWPSRSPRRHYFLFRNAILLMQRPYVPFVWKIWAVAKLCTTALVQITQGRSGVTQLKQMMLGAKEGLKP